MITGSHRSSPAFHQPARTTRRARRGVAALALLTLAVGVAPHEVRAGAGASAAPSFPANVTLGQTGLTAIVQLSNENTPNNTMGVNVVCNGGDPAPCPAGDPGITLLPSCGKLGTFSDCDPAGTDAGVFAMHDFGTGVAGTACEGMTFDVKTLDAATGRLVLIPSNGAHVVLANTGTICQIALLFDVVRMPTIDHDPVLPGVQTVQIVDNTQTTTGGLTASARGTSTGVTVAKALPAITTVASPPATIGGTLTDTAAVTGRVNPVDGATITFNLYDTTDTTCSGAPIFTATVPIAADGTAASPPFTPSAPGSYRWIASYSGDANNSPVAGVCGDTGETGTINRAQPAISTVASPSVPQGHMVSDIATVTGRVSPIPGATVTFRLYADGDLACVAPPIFTSVALVTPEGRATSANFMPETVGTYRWIATYDGDANNAPVSGLCTDTGESVTITPFESRPPIPVVGSASRELLAWASLLTVAGSLLQVPARRRRAG